MDIKELFENAKKIFTASIFRNDCQLLFSIDKAIEYQFNDVATQFYLTTLESSSFDDAVQVISEKYQVDSSIITKDYGKFLGSFAIGRKTNGASAMEDAQLEKKVRVKQLSAPLSIEFELTKACNFHCPFCYNTWKHTSVKTSEMSHLPKDAIKKALLQCKELGLFKVRYSGGEPTLYPYLSEIIEYASELNFFQSVFTNAYNLTEETITFWKNHKVNEVLISLHGLKEQHESITKVSGSFESTCNSIVKLVNHGIHVIVEMTLVSSNLGEIDDVLKKVNELGVSEFRIMKYVPNGVKELDEQLSVSDEQFEQAIQCVYSNNLVINHIINVAFPCSQKFCNDGEVRADNSSILYNCRAGINWIAVSYEGNVKICPHSTKTFGNICDENASIFEIWNNGTKPEVLSIIESRPQQCHECVAWDKCFGGCLLK